MRGLYAIVDHDTLGPSDLSVTDFARALLDARPAALQLRAKNAGARDTLELLRALLPLCRARGVPLFANDRPDLALLAGADGVHVGQDDVPVTEVRAFAPGLRIGVSTHDASQLEQMLDLAPDYVAFGPVFPTQSKAEADPVVGLAGLEGASRSARARGIALVAIGGIDLQRAPVVAPHADAGAVIRALLPEGAGPTGITERARALHRALGGEA
jgi:thiamine-phosphate pyrophosphorylase